MAPPVTEYASFAIKPDADVRSVMIDAATTLVSQPGCQRVRWGKQIENPEKLSIFIDWDTKASHEKFMGDKEYGPFIERLGAILAGPPARYHVPFQPFPPTVLNNDLPEESGKGKTPVTELLHLFFPADYSTEKQEKAAAICKGLSDAIVSQDKSHASGEYALGWADEEVDYEGAKAKDLVLAIGWHSVEAHERFKETDLAKATVSSLKGLAELKGISLYHSVIHVFEKTG